VNVKKILLSEARDHFLIEAATLNSRKF